MCIYNICTISTNIIIKHYALSLPEATYIRVYSPCVVNELSECESYLYEREGFQGHRTGLWQTLYIHRKQIHDSLIFTENVHSVCNVWIQNLIFRWLLLEMNCRLDRKMIFSRGEAYYPQDTYFIKNGTRWSIILGRTIQSVLYRVAVLDIK